ncbi:MAG TPA: RecQ family ATP-dependent DNA helicase [Cyclobacteriaceae bacterium]|nr:RecQ family ATP-dependent DNA helicase [Cyclobacteriaceae bacterium]HMV11217.1 RecQ family ATP-dependent DNA helicase [Cyclobacteriaceae bacterium]HMX02556.1 RecQ family ATP-dependent DNA helicase [Cyclobacteriaceae bacterium]HMX50945.1 RecQ family ATP-dependent DNA helicase [Cyclobacteriaceae bacterium]HMY92221.1 RecQ family ATP-dependent DNA helicase [Cyclobacteriaceae bacterium]
MEDSLSILKKYWGHAQFRALQPEIINSILAGHDTLALLPTGGGKSVCFQVPGLQLEGLCIVISPLIALMKDQVENLKSKGIHAVAVHSAMSREEIDIHLNNCIHGDVKFLYLSPERLHTEIFVERVKQMNVGLIAVDEAHCISQWGYDFRPSYLQIASLRELLPDVRIIALTASATPQVKDDIVDKLKFRKGHQVFQKTFARENLSFVVRRTENKERKLMEVLQKVQGPVIIYSRSRKGTHELSDELNKKGISSIYYHAGLTFEQRTDHQEQWIKNKKRVMVATNAFGMGIDKPDVRIVAHLDLPENLESYYQEAGRAGRDGKMAYAVVIYHDSDVTTLQTKTKQSQPSVIVLKKTYQALANFYQLAQGSGEGESFDFDLYNFCDRFELQAGLTYNALRKLEEEGLIEFNESFYSPSVVHIAVDKTRLYEFQVANEQFDPLIKMLLRLYGGQLFSDFTKISESYLAKGLKMKTGELISALRHLHDLKIIIYKPAKEKPQITFIVPRQDAEKLPLDVKRLEERKALIESKMKAMTNFVTSTHRCRMQLIQEYFGEETFQTCGKCDVCIELKKKESSVQLQSLRGEIITLVKSKLYTIDQLEKRIAPSDTGLFIDLVREMVDEGELEYDKVWRLKIPARK